MARKPPERNNVGLMSIHSPGAYLRVLEKRAERELFDDLGALSDIGGDELAAREQSYRARVMALVDQRLAAGEPVNCQSWELPSGLHAPFESFPIGGQRCFVVDPSDTITLRPRKSRSA
ncbi:hypothetical protein [Mycobacterium avium]|jgi:hypothetical protein|uniref:hypothetical protein n=1 Tax=Mycobacterium avium TaxID=1764 RepID=UPI0004255FA7|nr:hypothetical protein [Mycobacterium avium]KBR62188.1 hypothetical protein X425_02741 [Mycobacterium avium XTB13-223]MCA2296325.1 hypothetical protein [Mycobacterium avium]MCA4761382.1 hypothetical protein [Mycobacterium avium subsp. hominissuis]MDO2355756.1 hypothetical protein [Mycobacterium avium subsp. hominissuis]MDV3271681.1 hypothetical protein [Mycobacterium avium]